MTLEGFVGTLEIEGDLASFASLLRTAEVVYVGEERHVRAQQVLE